MKTAPAPLITANPQSSVDVPGHVCDAIATRLSRRVTNATREVAAAWDVVRSAERLVLAALPKRLDEAWLAEILRVDQSELREAFTQVRGVTPYRAIMGARLEAVRQTVASHPQLSVAAVAGQCGFPSFGRFIVEWEVYFGPDVPAPRQADRRSKPVRLKPKAAARRPAKRPEEGGSSGSPMAKYDPLRRYLRRRREDVVELSFVEIEQILGDILPHAAGKSAWWSNEAGRGRGLVQCGAWLEAGFHVADLEAGKRVCFRRQAVSARSDPKE